MKTLEFPFVDWVDHARNVNRFGFRVSSPALQQPFLLGYASTIPKLKEFADGALEEHQ